MLTGGLATAGLGVVGLGRLAAGIGGRVLLGSIEGGATQIGDNLLHGRSWNDGVEGAMVLGAATGGLSPLGGAALRQVTKRFGREAVADGPKAMKGSACGCNACGMSFSADTTVATPDGMRPIASVKVGDKALAYDPDTKAVTSQNVEQTFVNYDSDRIDVTLETADQATDRANHRATSPKAETIHTTANHPWLTADRGWVDAGELQIGEPVQLATGSIARVDGLQSVAGAGLMYDLGLEQVHTFSVGDGAYVVDNCGGLWNKAEFQGKRIYQRDDLIDLNRPDALGESSLSRMRRGAAPIGPDGKSVNLHHMLQTDDGPIAEVAYEFNRKWFRVIHINPSRMGSGIDRDAFDAWREDYWMNRADEFVSNGTQNLR